MDDQTRPQQQSPNELPITMDIYIPGKGSAHITCKAFALFFGDPEKGATFKMTTDDGQPMTESLKMLVSTFVGGSPEGVHVMGAYAVHEMTQNNKLGMNARVNQMLLEDGIIVLPSVSRLHARQN